MWTRTRTKTLWELARTCRPVTLLNNNESFVLPRGLSSCRRPRPRRARAGVRGIGQQSVHERREQRQRGKRKRKRPGQHQPGRQWPGIEPRRRPVLEPPVSGALVPERHLDDDQRHRLRPRRQRPALRCRRLRAELYARGDHAGHRRDVVLVRSALYGRSRCHGAHRLVGQVHHPERARRREHPARHSDRQVAKADHDPHRHAVHGQRAARQVADLAEEPHGRRFAEHRGVHGERGHARVSPAAHRRRCVRVRRRRERRRTHSHLPGRQRPEGHAEHEPRRPRELGVAMGQRRRHRQVRHRPSVVRRLRDDECRAKAPRRRAPSRRPSTTT